MNASEARRLHPHNCEGRHKKARGTDAQRINWACEWYGYFYFALMTARNFDLEFIWPAFHISAAHLEFWSRE